LVEHRRRSSSSRRIPRRASPSSWSPSPCCCGSPGSSFRSG
jgi:hypothetical protein